MDDNTTNINPSGQDTGVGLPPLPPVPETPTPVPPTVTTTTTTPTAAQSGGQATTTTTSVPEVVPSTGIPLPEVPAATEGQATTAPAATQSGGQATTTTVTSPTGETVTKTEIPVVPPTPKKKLNKKVLIGGLVVLILAVVVVGAAAIFPQFTGENRGKAFIPCDPVCTTGFRCVQGDCVPVPTATATTCTKVNGGWSGWNFSCTGHCGETQTRTCSSPSPSCGGAECSGSNYHACPACTTATATATQTVTIVPGSCTPFTYSCTNGSFNICLANGNGYQRSPCPSGQCNAAGTECTGTVAACPHGVNDQCSATATCSDACGSCQYGSHTEGAYYRCNPAPLTTAPTVAPVACDGSGSDRFCETSAIQCTSGGGHTAAGYTCGGSQVCCQPGTGTSCDGSGGGRFCESSGTQCGAGGGQVVSGYTCSGSQVCCKPVGAVTCVRPICTDATHSQACTASGAFGTATPCPLGCDSVTGRCRTVAATAIPTGTTGTCGGLNQSCCAPENVGAGSICNDGLYCNVGAGYKCTASPFICQSPTTQASGQCQVYKCGNKCDQGNQCTIASGGPVACSGASLGGQCGQIDFLDTGGSYCGVKSQNCYGTCGGATTTATQGATATAGTVPNACVATRVYLKNDMGAFATTETPVSQLGSKVHVGDVIRLAVRGNKATFAGGQFTVKLGGVVLGTYEVTASLPLVGDPATKEYYYDYTIAQSGSYEIDGAVSVVAPSATASPTATATAAQVITTSADFMQVEGADTVTGKYKQTFLSADGTQIYDRFYDNGWGTWTITPAANLGISGVSAVRSVSQSKSPSTGQIKYDALTTDGRTVYTRFYTNGAWGAWTSLAVSGLGMSGQSASSSFMQVEGADTVTGKYKQTFLSADGTQIYDRFYDNGWGTWTITPAANLGISGVSAVRSVSQSKSPSTGQIKYDALTTDGRTVYTRFYTNGAWGAWTSLAVSGLNMAGTDTTLLPMLTTATATATTAVYTCGQVSGQMCVNGTRAATVCVPPTYINTASGTCPPSQVCCRLTTIVNQ